jgi:hypothetical protein
MPSHRRRRRPWGWDSLGLIGGRGAARVGATAAEPNPRYCPAPYEQVKSFFADDEVSAARSKARTRNRPVSWPAIAIGHDRVCKRKGLLGRLSVIRGTLRG